MAGVCRETLGLSGCFLRLLQAPTAHDRSFVKSSETAEETTDVSDQAVLQPQVLQPSAGAFKNHHNAV